MPEQGQGEGRALGLWPRGPLNSSALGHPSVFLFAYERSIGFLANGVCGLLECPLKE